MKRLLMFGLALLMCTGVWAGDTADVRDYSAGLFGGDRTIGVWGKYSHFGLRVGVVEGDDSNTTTPTVQACSKPKPCPKPKPKPTPVPTPTAWQTGDAQFASFQGYFPIPGAGKCTMGALDGNRNRVLCRLSGFVGAGLSRTEEFLGTQTDHAYNLEYNLGAEYIFPIGLVVNGGYDSLVEGFVGVGWGRTFGRK